MAFGDFLGGLVQGGAQEVTRRREEKRTDIQAGVANKQALGKLVLEGLVSGRVRPEFGSRVLGELQSLSEPRQPERGLAGFMGGQQLPQTPQLDTLAGGGWNQGFYNPEELAKREAEQETYASSLKLQGDLRSKVSMLPTFIAELVKQGIPEDMARSAAMQMLWGANAFGAQGTPTTYWDPERKAVFRGQKDNMRGIVDITTNQVVPGSRAVQVDYEDNPNDGTRRMIDRFTGEILSTTPGVVAPPRPQMPFFQGGGAYMMPGMQMPSFYPVPGAPPGGSTAPQINPEQDTLRFHLEQIDKSVQSQLGLIKDQIRFESAPGSLEVEKTKLQDQLAKQWGYPDYKTLISRLGGMPTRIAPVSAHQPGSAAGAPAIGGTRTDADGQPYTIRPR